MILASSSAAKPPNLWLWDGAEHGQDHRGRMPLVEINRVGRDTRRRRGRGAEWLAGIRVDFELGRIGRGGRNLYCMALFERKRGVPQVYVQLLGFARRHQHHIIGIPAVAVT